MGTAESTAAIAGAIATVLPSVVALVRALAAKTNPTDPPPTDAQVLAAFAATCTHSLAADEAWLAAHPATPPPAPPAG